MSMKGFVAVAICVATLALPGLGKCQESGPTVKQEALCNVTCRNKHVDDYTDTEVKLLDSMTVCTCKGAKGGAIAVYRLDGDKAAQIWVGEEGEEISGRAIGTGEARQVAVSEEGKSLSGLECRPGKCPACNCRCKELQGCCNNVNRKVSVLLGITVTSLMISAGMLIWSAVLATQ